VSHFYQIPVLKQERHSRGKLGSTDSPRIYDFIFSCRPKSDLWNRATAAKTIRYVDWDFQRSLWPLIITEYRQSWITLCRQLSCKNRQAVSGSFLFKAIFGGEIEFGRPTFGTCCITRPKTSQRNVAILVCQVTTSLQYSGVICYAITCRKKYQILFLAKIAFNKKLPDTACLCLRESYVCKVWFTIDDIL